MNTEYDEPERLEFSWDGLKKLEAAKAKWHKELRARLTADFFAKFSARPISHCAPRRTSSAYISERLLPWSAASVMELGASLSVAGDADFVPCSAQQVYEHFEAMSRERAWASATSIQRISLR